MKAIRVLQIIIVGTVALVASAQADTAWNADVSIDAAWSVAGNWSAGVPDSNDVAYFTNTQATTYSVDVDSAAQAHKLHVTQGYTFDGAGSLTLIRNDASSLNQTLGNYSPSTTLTINTDVTINQLGAGVAEVYNQYAGGNLILNGSFTQTGNNYINLSGLGTIELNGDITLVDRFRFGKDGLNVVIGGSGTTTSSAAWTFARAANLYLNRTGAYTTAAEYLYMERAMLFLGADNALAAGTDVRMKANYGTGGITAQGFDQAFGWLDVDADAFFDLGGTDSVWTFEDSSLAISDWASGVVLYITNAPSATIRFAIDSGSGGTGLTEIQIGKISLDGVVLTSNDTTVADGYLYITPLPAAAETSWNSDVSEGAAWETAGNWSDGVPGSGSVAYFTNTQSTTYTVTVDSAAMANQLYADQAYTFDGAGSITLIRNDAASINQALGNYSLSTTLTLNTDVTINELGAGVAEIYSQYAGGRLVLNGSLTHTGNNYMNLSGDGTIELNGDIDLVDRFRFGKDGLNVVIGGSGTTASSTAWTFARAANLYLNRTGAYTTDQQYLYMEKAMVTLGADQALAEGTDVRMKNSVGTGGITAQGYDQNFGWLDVDYDAFFDFAGSDSVWTFEDSSLAESAWATDVVLYITNAQNATIRFAIDSGSGGTGLSDSQIEKISLNGTLLTTNDTSVSDGYLYIANGAGSEALYNMWAGEYELTSPESDLLSDPDGDGANNLLEYALGGNPTNSDASAILPVYSVTNQNGTNWLEYVYFRRLDAADRGINYTVEKNSNLLSVESWSTNGIAETSAPVDAEFESVTNRVSTGEANAQFMKLNVEF
ncbi:hypothetical protein [Tichowtungia aerotolerans]|uniref:Autotransporter outer membrane beta-barrel domain-containing protein n=1 Tax=Tichowtungia aerotolerans TaxID=2697043 RepID=A0A6P1M6Y8_9BACT|nr:hypothetical protein [Tichowtungia aerotolerans]QHI70350.1 hypothetical protein GT409_13175 [Tichowtungia aerotolerans]